MHARARDIRDVVHLAEGAAFLTILRHFVHVCSHFPIEQSVRDYLSARGLDQVSHEMLHDPKLIFLITRGAIFFLIRSLLELFDCLLHSALP